MPSHIYLARFIPGIQRFVTEEIEAKLGDVKIIAGSRDRVSFQFNGDPRQLLQLRNVEEIHLCLRYLRNVDRSRSQLKRLESALRNTDLREALRIAQRMGLRWRHRLTARVRAQMVGRHNFRRVDIQRVVERALIGRPDLRLRIAREGRWGIEIHADVIHDEAYLLWRLTDEAFRQHDEKQSHRPGSLRPSVAYAMVQASQPQAEEIFLDPMCGAGTILLERAHCGRYHGLLGGDISWDALQSAAANIGPRHQPRLLLRWDAVGLPLAPHSVDKIVCNLPFGKQIALPHPRFYHEFLAECRRVRRKGGRAVFLVADRSKLLEAARETGWQVHDVLRVDLLGQRAFMLTLA